MAKLDGAVTYSAFSGYQNQVKSLSSDGLRQIQDSEELSLPGKIWFHSIHPGATLVIEILLIYFKYMQDVP